MKEFHVRRADSSGKIRRRRDVDGIPFGKVKVSKSTGTTNEPVQPASLTSCKRIIQKRTQDYHVFVSYQYKC